MKKYLILTVFLFSSILYSQTMNVHMKDGSVTQHNLIEIDSITFTINYDVETDTIAYYSFNGTANDESGNGYNGTIHGASLTTDRFASDSSAFGFDGVNDYINISHPDLQPNVLFQNSFSIEAWIKLNTISGTQTIISFGYDTGDPMLFEVHEGRMRLHMELAGGDYNPANTTLSIDTWYHVKIVGILGEGITFYLNDAVDGTETVWGSMSGTQCAIGAGYDGSPGRFFNGTIDELIIKSIK